MPSRAPDDSIPPEAFLTGYPPPIMALGQRLRWVVKRAVPDSIERVRPGWRLIGYDLPSRRQGVFFAWVWPELEHVHLGFPHGVLMDDPNAEMKGAVVSWGGGSMIYVLVGMFAQSYLRSRIDDD